MTPFFAFLLGILQGLTEFLPVSSSGHLAAARLLHGMQEPELSFDIAVHAATLAAVLIYFRKPIGALLLGLAGRSVAGEPPPNDQRYLALLIGLTLLPTGLVFLWFQDSLEQAGTQPLALAAAFLATALLLLGTRWAARDQVKVTTWREMSLAAALLIGLAQGAALTPGVSRSGATIAVALFLGLDRELAVRFSFIMAIPAIAGAMLLPLARGLEGMSPVVLVSGMAGAFAVGLASIHLLRWVVLARRLHWFAIYVAVVALTVLMGT